MAGGEGGGGVDAGDPMAFGGSPWERTWNMTRLSMGTTHYKIWGMPRPGTPLVVGIHGINMGRRPRLRYPEA